MTGPSQNFDSNSRGTKGTISKKPRGLSAELCRAGGGCCCRAWWDEGTGAKGEGRGGTRRSERGLFTRGLLQPSCQPVPPPVGRPGGSGGDSIAGRNDTYKRKSAYTRAREAVHGTAAATGLHPPCLLAAARHHVLSCSARRGAWGQRQNTHRHAKEETAAAAVEGQAVRARPRQGKQREASSQFATTPTQRERAHGSGERAAAAVYTQHATGGAMCAAASCARR